MERRVTPKQGWRGIAAALAKARSGDVVLVAAGHYRGDETLNVPSGVTLAGTKGTLLDYGGDTAAVGGTDAKKVTVRDLEIAGYSGLSDSPDTGENEDEYVVGLVNFRRVSGLTIEGCVITGHALRRSCIAIVSSTGVQILNVQAIGARRGITFWSSTGTISGNLCQSSRTGIQLALDPENSDVDSDAEIIANRCYDNLQFGIAFISSKGAVRENECKGAVIGIAISIAHEYGRRPSQAEIIGNKCHGNKSSGICIFSSIARIEGNVCHSNDSGIVVQREEEFRDIAPDPSISRNRCHDNVDVGIYLHSSPGVVHENECWSNHNGIVLSRDSHVRDVASEADVTANRCFQNRAGGIVIASSFGLIQDNDCWSNRIAGISIEKHIEGTAAKTTSSTAEVTANRCHDNRLRGIALLSSTGTISENECWANGEHGILLMRGTKPGHPPAEGTIVGNRCQDNREAGIISLSSFGAIRDNLLGGNSFGDQIAIENHEKPAPELPTLSGNRSGVAMEELRLHDRALIARLAAEKENLPADDMAGFLMSGCTGCFGRVATRYRGAPRRNAPADNPDARHRHYRIAWDGKTHSFFPDAGTGLTPVDAIAALARETRPYAQGKASWIGLIAPDDREADLIADALAGLSVSSTGELEPADLLPPLKVDYGPRNDLGSATPPLPLFEEELTFGFSRLRLWRERLGCIMRLPLVWFVLLLSSGLALLPVIAFDWARPAADAVGGLFASLMATYAAWWGSGPAWASIATLLLGLFIFDLLLTALNLFLPRRLHLRMRWLRPLSALASALFSIKDIRQWIDDHFGPVFRRRWLDPWSTKAWLKWVSRRLYRSHSVSTILITHVENWRAEDLQRLRLLAAARPKGSALCGIIQMDGRVCVFPAMLDRERALPWDNFRLILSDDDSKLKLDVEALKTAAAGADPDYSLIGPPPGSDTDREELEGSLTDDQWSPIDLLPALSIASAPTGKFSVRRKQVVGDAQAMVELGPQFDAYQRLFVPEPRSTAGDAETVGELFRRGTVASSIRAYKSMQGRQTYIRLAGRVGRRNQVAKLISRLWGDEVDTREYLASALGCGMFGMLTLAQDAAARLGQTNDDSRPALVIERALEALIFLGDDLARVREAGCPVHGQDHLAQAWAALDDMFEEARVDTPLAPFYGAYLGARHACGIEGPQIEACLEEARRQLAASRSGEGLAPGEAAPAQFAAGLARRIEQLALVSDLLGPGVEDRMRRQHWRLLPPPLAGALAGLLAEAQAAADPLAILLDRAATPAEVEELILLHAQWPLRLLYSMGLVAAAHVRRGKQKEAVEGGLGVIGCVVAEAMETLRPPYQADDDRNLLAGDLGRASAVGLVDGAAVARYLDQPGASRHLVALLRTGETAPDVALDGIIDTELERVLLLSEAITARLVGNVQYRHPPLRPSVAPAAL